jgi:hypothetical protein
MGLETLPIPPWYDLSCSSTIQMDTTNLIVGAKQTFDSTTKELVFKTTVYPSLTEVERLRIGSLIKTSVNIIPTVGLTTIDLGSVTSYFRASYITTSNSTTANVTGNVVPTHNVSKLGTSSTTRFLSAYVGTVYCDTVTATADTTTANITVGTGANGAITGYSLSLRGGNIQMLNLGNILPAHNVSTIGTSNTDRFLSGYFGTVYANGVALTSDRRLKDNIKPITNGLSTVLRMKPVEYNMKGRVRLHTGFLADEMQNLYNGEDWACFVEDNDEAKTQSLQYTEVVAILVKAIQEMNEGSPPPAVHIESKMVDKYPEENNQRFDEISSKIEELTSEISELKTKNIELSNELDIVKNRQALPIVKEAKIEIEDSDNGGITMIESLQERLYKSEQLIAKQATMIKKLTVAVNKLLKGSE